MLLLASAFFLTLLQCSNGLNKTSITPADCNTVETDAGVALDLVNRHRRDGYVFGLMRVADAQELHIGNSSVLYLTLDVLETECSVLSRRHWESCEYSDTYSMDFGQCRIITYTSQLLKKPQLYGFNCTLSPVPPDLLECKDCPVKVEILEVTEQHKNTAAKALEKFNSEGNHTNYFDVDKVEKMTASREGHILGFSIKETNCSKSTQQADQALECDFLDDWHAHVGFCKARIISDLDEPDETDISCEIYHPWQHDYGQRCRYSTLGQPHRHPHHHFGHRHHLRHHHRHHHRHGCPPSSQSRPEDPEHNHSFNEEHQDSHEGPAPPPPPHCGPHHHLHPPHCCPPPPPHGGPHHHPPPPHHRPHCPLPPHGPHHHHPSPHRGPHHPPPPPGRPPHLYHHYYRHHCNKTSISGKSFPLQITGAVYRTPVLNHQDSLTPPAANFPELSQSNPHSSSTGEGIPFTGSSLKEMPEAPGFPDHPTQSKSCPGNPKLVLPKILSLFPHSSMAENSPT
ncbi:PREDICTED: histidine-rich glycoprotein [Pygoscelis adeliae]|uniref:histidine-rich glycoprotein n=1 Tax=Pygoscelis adeliae TaxID=9238 RepID=UPI0004F506B4|nr:PREDICTED: histidine-rich glycoprotein [Pygoscelis adeliae]